MAPTYKLSYFNARGFAEQSRFVFAFAGVPFEDIRYEHDAKWLENKPRFEWGALPVLEVDGKQLAQSKAILRYLGQKFNLAGDNQWEAAQCDEHIEALADLRTACYFLWTEKDEEEKAKKKAAAIADTLPKYYSKWNDILEKNNGFLVGKRFSYADFGIATASEFMVDKFGAESLDKYPAVKAHQKAVYSAKGIKEWVAKRPKTEN